MKTTKNEKKTVTEIYDNGFEILGKYEGRTVKYNLAMFAWQFKDTGEWLEGVTDHEHLF